MYDTKKIPRFRCYYRSDCGFYDFAHLADVIFFLFFQEKQKGQLDVTLLSKKLEDVLRERQKVSFNNRIY